MIKRMSNDNIKNIAGGGPETLEVRAVEAPGNISKFVLVNKETGNWVGLFGVEYLPGTYNVTESSNVGIISVLDSLKTSILAQQPNFRRSDYPVFVKGADGVFRQIGINGGAPYEMPRLISSNGNSVVSTNELYQNVSYLGSFTIPTLSAY